MNRNGFLILDGGVDVMFESEIYLAIGFILVVAVSIATLICTGASAINKIKKEE